MASALAPFRAVGTALRAAGAAFTHAGQRGASEISFVSNYLQNVLYLLSQQFLDLARNGYAGNAAVYACLKLLSQSVPEPPLIASTEAADGTTTPLPRAHPLQALIRRPNPLMTEYELHELTTLHLAIVGRSVWWKERSNAGQIIALWPLRPDRVGPIYDTGRVISGWSYLVPGTSNYVPIAAADVWLTNFADPAGESGGMVEGLGPLQVLASEVGADNEATRFVGAMLANYGTPGVVLKVKGGITSRRDADLLKASFRQEYGGVRRGSPGVVDADTDLVSLGFNLQQLEFPAVRKISESRIAAAFGTPAILAGLLVGLEAGIKATIAEQREYFAETTLSNYWRREEDSFSRDVGSEFGPDLVCRFDTRRVKALSHQSRAEADKVAEGFKAGAVSYDEFRDRVLGLPPLPSGGGRRVLPRGAIEIDENGNLVNQPTPAAAAPAVPAEGTQP